MEKKRKPERTLPQYSGLKPLLAYYPPAEIPSSAHLRLHTLRLEQEVVTMTMTPIVPKHHTISLAMIHHELMVWFNAKTTPLYEPNQQSTLLIS